MRAVVVDMEAVSHTDTEGADMLTSLASEMKSAGTWFGIARAGATILDQWDRAGALDAIGRVQVFRSVREAVDAARGMIARS